MSRVSQFLSIKGAVLDNERLGEYVQQVAISHDLIRKSSMSTYPVPRLRENFEFIEDTYRLLNEHVEKGMHVYPAGEWLLDNFYIIEEAVQTVLKEITPKKYKDFPGLASNGFSRIYVLATETIAHTDGRINEEVLEWVIDSYQRKKSLRMEEMWSFSMFLNIAMIEKIRGICEKIYSAQIQKYKVESIIERLVDAKEYKHREYSGSRSLDIGHNQMRYPFIEYMSHRLKQYGRKALPYLAILEEQVNKMGMTISEVIQKEHFDIAVRKSFLRK